MKKEQFVTSQWQNETAELLQPPDTVWDLFNCRITNNNSSSYAIELVNGNKFCFQINPDYKALRFISALDKIIVYSTNNQGNGEVGIVNINEAVNTGAYVPLYNHVDFNFDIAYPIYGKFLRENPNIQRSYFWDGLNPPRVINVADPFYVTYYNQAAIVGSPPGTAFMVLFGTVTNLSGTYGPGQASTVFNVDGTEVLSLGALVISFRDPAVLELTPSVDVGNIRFFQWLTNGSLNNGNWCYFYQIGDGQAYGSYSYVSRPVHITSSIPGAQPDYQEYVGLGVPSNINTQKGIRIQIENIDTNFPMIRVGAIHFTGIDTYDSPIIFAEELITGSTMTFDHLDNFGLEFIAIEEVIGNRISIKTNKTGAISNNYLFLGHVKLRPEPVYDPSVGTLVRPIEYLMPSDSTDYFLGRHPDHVTLRTVLNLNGHDPGSAVILAAQWYIVKGTPILTVVNYNGTDYGPGHVNGDVFQGIQAVTTWSIVSGTPVVNPILHIQKYAGKFDNIEIIDDYLDHKGMTPSTFMKSNWRGSTTRLAMVLHDLNGNPTYAKWIKDQPFPQQYETVDDSGNTINCSLVEEHTNSGGAGYTQFSLRSLGIQIDQLNLKEISDNLGIAVADLPLYFRGFSIVRAPIDCPIMAQGILWPTVCGLATPNLVNPMTTVQIPYDADVNFGVSGRRRENFYCFYSPDFLFNFNNLPNKVTGDKLKIVDYYFDNNQANAFGAGTEETNNGANIRHYYHKYFYKDTSPAPQFSPLGTENELEVSNCNEVQVNQIGFPISPAITFNNDGGANAALVGVLTACAGGRVFVVNTKGVEGIAADPLEFGFGVGIDTTAGATGANSTNETRPIVNYLRNSNTLLYGGSSASAKANTQYVSMGHYQAFDDDFMTYLAGTAGVASGIQIFGGNAFIGFFDFARMIENSTLGTPFVTYGLIYPIESNTNFNLREGRHLSKDRSRDAIQNPNGIVYGTGNSDKPESLVYNPAYSNDVIKAIVFPALPVNFIDNNILEHTVFYSLRKQDGEVLDNFRIIKSGNYQNVEGVFGPLTGLIFKNNKLYYIQQKAVGYLPVNEKQAISGTEGAALVIGTGGVIPRFDTLNDHYGTESQSSIFITDEGFGFFDIKRKSFCHVVSGSVDALSVYKGIRSFLITNIKNSTRMHESPFTGYGISAIYDNQRKYVIMSFKQLTADSGSPATDFTIIFDLLNKAFAGRTGYASPIYEEHNDKIYSVCDQTPSNPILDNTDYNLYTFVTEGNSLYMCILAYTSATPAVIPSLDATHWELINKINDVYVNEYGDICKFYGLVQPAYVSLIFNDQKEVSKQIDNFEYHQNQSFWDNVVLQNSWQTAQDIAIDIVNNREYDFRNRVWFATAPQADTGKMTDLWCKITLYKNNLVNSNPTISKNELIKFISLVTYFEIAE